MVLLDGAGTASGPATPRLPRPLDFAALKSSSSFSNSPKALGVGLLADVSPSSHSSSPNLAVTVTNIQFTFDPTHCLPSEDLDPDNRKLFATVRPNASTKARSTAATAPVILNPSTAVVSWYQRWSFPVEDPEDAALTISVAPHRRPRQALGQTVIPLKGLQPGACVTARVPLCPSGGTLCVYLQLIPTATPTLPTVRFHQAATATPNVATPIPATPPALAPRAGLRRWAAALRALW
eukprot:RCo003539